MLKIRREGKGNCAFYDYNPFKRFTRIVASLLENISFCTCSPVVMDMSDTFSNPNRSQANISSNSPKKWEINMKGQDMFNKRNIEWHLTQNSLTYTNQIVYLCSKKQENWGSSGRRRRRLYDICQPSSVWAEEGLGRSCNKIFEHSHWAQARRWVALHGEKQVSYQVNIQI